MQHGPVDAGASASTTAQLGRSTGRCSLEWQERKATGARRGGSVLADGERAAHGSVPAMVSHAYRRRLLSLCLLVTTSPPLLPPRLPPSPLSAAAAHRGRPRRRRRSRLASVGHLRCNSFGSVYCSRRC
ncbi:hypothetical protein PVAP13_1KG131800 [Panicum virgatum]|uniref:Uncharacterized protein n=1 Tax=Panicum virgatum TaxID=38727 RepID=A0A8T0X9D9_PANVG|nr:hypothetical protein PVAP13_1KG131800 [Panicum virgatum]